MAVTERSITMSAQWAAAAQTAIPVPPLPGIAYRNSKLTDADIESGQAYDKAYDSARYNQLDYLTTGLLRQAEQYGIMPYCKLTNYPKSGLCMGPDGSIYQAAQANGPGTEAGPQPLSERSFWIRPFEKYDLCEFYYFRNPTLKPGFLPAHGGMLENAATLYPEAWAYLQTPEGQLLCKTEAEWQALTTKTYYTLADGTNIGYNGIGGAPFYAPNIATGALRLPDVRGMYMEASGPSLGAGEVHLDGVRNATGRINGTTFALGYGVFANNGVAMGSAPQGGSLNQWTFDLSRVVPTAARNQPCAYGVNACVYLGSPVAA